MNRTNKPKFKDGQPQALTRRDMLLFGGALAVGANLPLGGLVRSAQAQTAGFDYYIGPNGSDSNPGTQSQPWSLRALTSKGSTYGGKRVGLLDGTYSLLDILGVPASGGFSGNRINVAGGSASSPTVLASVNPQGAIISGDRDRLYATNRVDWEMALIGPGGDYVTFDGIRFQQANYRTINNYGGGDFFTIQNCYFTDQYYITGNAVGANSSQVFMQGMRNCKISNCYFEKAGSPSDLNRHAMIQTYACDDFIVEYCTIVGQSSPYPSSNGIHFKGNPGSESRPGKRLTVRNCYIYTPTSTNSVCALRWHGNESTDGAETCHHNILVALNGAIPLYSEGIRNKWDIYNLTVIGGNYNSGLDFANDSPTQVSVRNTIFSRTGTGSYGDMRFSNSASNVLGTIDYNLWDSSPAAKISGGVLGVLSSLLAWQTASGKDAHSSQTADPQFVGSGADAEFYKLRSGAPGKTMGSGGAEIGAWGGATLVGASMGRLGPPPAQVVPEKPTLVSVG
jgi:hypothetical protein